MQSPEDQKEEIETYTSPRVTVVGIICNPVGGKKLWLTELRTQLEKKRFQKKKKQLRSSRKNSSQQMKSKRPWHYSQNGPIHTIQEEVKLWCCYANVTVERGAKVSAERVLKVQRVIARWTYGGKVTTRGAHEMGKPCGE